MIEISENSITINKEKNISSMKTKDSFGDKENINPNINNNLPNSDTFNLGLKWGILYSEKIN